MRKLWTLVVVMAALGLVAGCQQKDTGQAERPPDQQQPEESAKAPDTMKPEEGEQPAPDEPGMEEGKEGAEKGDELVPQEEAKKPSEMEPAEPKEDEAASPAPPERTVEPGQPKEDMGAENVRRMDNQLEREFKRKVRADSRLSEYEIKADVKNCELAITGSVANDELKMKADAIAKTVTGLKAVRNELMTNAKMAEMPKMTDDDFRDELEDKIDADSDLRDHKFEVMVQGGKATITGIVPSEEAKKKITMLAETVQGLGEVNNLVRVQPAEGAAVPGDVKPKTAAEPAPAPEERGTQPQPAERRGGAPEEARSDWAMAMELRTKLLSDSQLNAYDIETDVTRGIITMTGAVPNEEYKRKAERLAKSVADAREIKNNITIVEGPVPPAEARSDTAIKAELKAKLLSDSQLSGWKTKIDVNNGIVTMSGTVATEDVKKKAGMLAETVAGVKEIRNDIAVEGAARERTAMDDDVEEAGREADQKKPEMEKETKEKGAEMSDDALAKKIEAKYMTEAQLKGCDVQVQVKKGAATLTGSVRSEEQRQMAERIARQTEGVKEVKNKLEVKPAETQ